MNFYKSEHLSKFSNLKHGFISNFERDKFEEYSSHNGLNDILTVKQIHSDKILKLTPDSSHTIEGDSIYTDLKGLGVGIFTADCLPIIYYAEKENVVGAIHAGWRGSLNRIAEKTFNFLTNELKYDSFSIHVAIGPCIKGNCYEVGGDVATQFESIFGSGTYLTRKNEDKFNLNLIEVNIQQLENMGIKNIDVLDYCTFCEEKFPSYRRDGKETGRILSFVGLV